MQGLYYLIKKNRGMVLMYDIDENCQCYSI